MYGEIFVGYAIQFFDVDFNLFNDSLLVLRIFSESIEYKCNEMTGGVDACEIERYELMHDAFLGDFDVFVGFAFGFGFGNQLVS